MNDDFLYQHRPPVRQAFASRLYQQLAMIEKENGYTQKREILMNRPLVASRNWKYALLLLPILAAFSLMFFEPVRAATADWIKTVAGFIVSEQDESPLKELPGEASAAQLTEAVEAVPEEPLAAVEELVEPTVYEVTTQPLPDILQNPPLDILMPAWVPDGFTLNPDAGLAASENWLAMEWSDSNHAEIHLLIEKVYTGYTIPAGVDSTREVTVNGQPALLVLGFWDDRHQWDPNRGLSLDWEINGQHYRLEYFEREPLHNAITPITADLDAVIQTLLQMAESFK
jgi:hypothetical protein